MPSLNGIQLSMCSQPIALTIGAMDESFAYDKVQGGHSNSGGAHRIF